ncbi:PREDICTED: uncharacterized protein LOC104813174 [Tarenaya hassleriana]|uniref:uncharacterized protein LOC104813174 n=1 Tax=Tarenaya hassleriana TaxID=28532 RepID=UPI00053C6F88|nr:PREDICTED: uncharacterized protein LOC104813174 [Tarenaya hassleriana]
MAMFRSSLKPPLPKSPIHLRSRQIHRSILSSLRSPPGSLTKSQKPEQRPEISCELRALAKMVEGEIGDEGKPKTANFGGLVTTSVHAFERGRFYEEYSARRNERLKRKKGEAEAAAAAEEVKTTPYNLRAMREPATTKRRGTAKKQQLESLKKTVSTAYTETPRYMLRSLSKENKKPPLPVNIERSVMKNVTTRRVRRI